MPSKNVGLDSTDRAILEIVQEDAAISKAELGRRVALTGPAVMDRLRRLEERHVIECRATRLQSESLGLGTLAFVLVKTAAKEVDDAAAQLAALANVQEVHHVAGEDCLLLKVRAADPVGLRRLLRDSVHTIPAVSSSRTTMVLETVKETTRLPLPEVEE